MSQEEGDGVTLSATTCWNAKFTLQEYSTEERKDFHAYSWICTLTYWTSSNAPFAIGRGDTIEEAAREARRIAISRRRGEIDEEKA